jgi:spore coat protein U-like protein
MKRILILAAMASVSTSAFAQSNDEVVNFEGEVAEVCDVTGYDNTINFGTLSATGATTPVSDTFSVYCNVRFNASIESDNGRLVLNNPSFTPAANPQPESSGNGSGYPGFNAAIDYSVSGTIGMFPFSANTTAIEAASPESLGTNLPPVSFGGSISYDTLDGANLLGGTYQDTLTLSLTPVSF